MASSAFSNSHRSILGDEQLRLSSEMPVKGCFTFEEILQFYQNVISTFFNDKDSLGHRGHSHENPMAIIVATSKILSLLDAAQTTYFDTGRASSSPKSEQHGEISAGPICVESTVRLGAQVLNKEEGNVVVRHFLKSAVVRLGREVSGLKQRICESGGSSEWDDAKVDSLEQMLTRIWALAAAMREP
ncbi:hypothetical protein yc1106_06476 [Curvularia clavata]|uniref:Uncharacterized protein n=1 Tax=Curvularia clavata TaxID=95742 RepID=A0A9Q8ZBT0_CURCL|nr:hypothetical protein yc1106_06476 [Curvularia clavata]